MTAAITAAAPWSVLGLAPIVVMVAIAIRRSHALCQGLSLGLLGFALWCVARASTVTPFKLTTLLVVDNFALYYAGIAIIAGIVLVVLGGQYIARREGHPEEYYVLLLTAIAGACAIGAANHFAAFYIALEVLSVSQYGLIGYVRRDMRGTEAGLKYLILAAVSTAFLLMGMALLYAETGSLQFAVMAQVFSINSFNMVALLGGVLFFAGVAFKLSLAPFHLWTPEVYEASPAPVAALISTLAKTAMLAAVLRLIVLERVLVTWDLLDIVAVFAALSMVIGNVLAMMQHSIKRLLAYSSVSHMGYIAAAFIVTGAEANEAVGFYALVYVASALCAWGVIITLSSHRDNDLERIEDYRGLAYGGRIPAIVLAVAMLSMAGIPLTGGFIGKLLILRTAVLGSNGWLIFVLAITSAIGALYYLRVLAVLFSQPRHGEAPHPRMTDAATATLITMAAIVVLTGIVPGPVLDVIRAIAPVAGQ